MIHLVDHPIGTHWSGSTERGYINIPKCASTSMKAIARQLNFTEKSIEDIDDRIYISIIRDPWARYISGVIEYITRYYRIRQFRFTHKKFFKTRNGDKYKLDQHFNTDKRMVFDAHTVPQYIFLEPFPNVNLFLMKDIKQVCEHLDAENPPLRNKTRRHYTPFINYISTKLKRDTGWYKTWEQVYAKDIDLFNQLNTDSRLCLRNGAS